jgi:CubicO group peptidase (beta-lactamase class C family)
VGPDPEGRSRAVTLQAGTVAIVQALDARIGAAIATWPVPHVAAGARTPDGTTHEAGAADRRFPLASVTKLLTAVAALVAVEEGSLGLDDAVDGLHGATILDLLCHASGLAFDLDERISPPRRKRIYSNRGYEILGEIVAARTGMRFADYLREGVLEPLAMTATTLDGSPAADATSTVGDLLRFAAGLPRLLSAETLTRATTPQLPELDGVLPGFGMQRPNPWGLGFEIRGSKSPHWTGTRNSPRTYGHFGRAGTFLWIDPDAGVALAVLTDRDFGDWATTCWPDLSDTVLSDTVLDDTVLSSGG